MAIGLPKIFYAFAFSASVVAGNAVASPLDISSSLPPKGKIVADFLKARGVNSFVLMDKERGQISLVEDGAVQWTKGALSGKRKGDAIAPNTLDVTPAGIFLMRMFNGGESLTYHDYYGGQVKYSIHAALNREREKLTQSGSPNQKRISAGCINVPAGTMSLINAFINKGGQTFLGNTTNEPDIHGSLLVVLPEKMPVEEILGSPRF